jgi:hypothetical protein
MNPDAQRTERGMGINGDPLVATRAVKIGGLQGLSLMAHWPHSVANHPKETFGEPLPRVLAAAEGFNLKPFLIPRVERRGSAGRA